MSHFIDFHKHEENLKRVVAENWQSSDHNHRLIYNTGVLNEKKP